MWMRAPGPADFGGAEIDSDAFGWLQRVEEIAIAAAEVENAFPGRNQKAHIAPFFFIVISMTASPAVALVGEFLGLFQQKRFAMAEPALRGSVPVRNPNSGFPVQTGCFDLLSKPRSNDGRLPYQKETNTVRVLTRQGFAALPTAGQPFLR